MDKPTLPDIDPQQVQLCARLLILACLSTEAEEMTITQEGFNKDGYVFGDFAVTVRKIQPDNH